MKNAAYIVALGGLLAAVSAGAQQTVYKTVEDGVPSFSDTAPAGGESAESVEVITLQTVPPSDDALLEQRLAEMRSTTDRMAEDRRERELHRAALREASPKPPPAVESVPEVVANGGYWPAYGRPHRPYLPRPPYRPGHTAPVPPPGWSVMQPRNSQLMRSVLPPRR